MRSGAWVADEALGLRTALREVFPETRQCRCRVRKVANTLDCLPKSAQLAAQGTGQPRREVSHRVQAIEAASRRWRYVSDRRLVALVRAGLRGPNTMSGS
jgi:transposase-like protein